ncbi:hypothetical protein [Vibrio rotiferianus]|uniref:hypothetical protein n=1 Tax=Vibrio rotiferianus TaxID=190895 RepID=UPI0005EF1FE6|nr:hypothetical protein [Vibrio rotiferianus]
MEHFTDRLREPLNETTRKSRRNLLAASILGIVTAKVGLLPTKISAFGVEFSASNLEALMTLLCLSIVYFLVTFIVYIASELQGWQLLISSKQLEQLKTESLSNDSFSSKRYEDMERMFENKLLSVYQRTKPIFYTRLVVELLIPTCIAIYAIIVTNNLDVTVLVTS